MIAAAVIAVAVIVVGVVDATDAASDFTGVWVYCALVFAFAMVAAVVEGIAGAAATDVVVVAVGFDSSGDRREPLHSPLPEIQPIFRQAADKPTSQTADE